MENQMIHTFNKYKTIFLFLIIGFALPSNIYGQFTNAEPDGQLSAIQGTANSESKPQSKVWRYLDKWYAVIPVPDDGVGGAAGTWLWRLDGDTWSKILYLASSTTAHADTKVYGNLTHILLYDGELATKLASVEYVSGDYQLWSTRTALVDLTLGVGGETATIDMDKNSIMWLAYDTSTDIIVKWSASPYTSWSSAITLATGVKTDDLCDITSFGGNKIGVMWSDQNARRFGFKYRNDDDPVVTWSANENPVSQYTVDLGSGFADDHINFAVGSDGSIYAAIKNIF